MKIDQKKLTSIILALIIVLAIFFRFWGIIDSDLQHDGAINAIRAYGWLDYLVGQGQTSPIIWFGQIPWWGNLSFHDHPPLVFLIQHIFFVIFGDSTLVALLPFLLAGLATTFLIYILLKKIRTKIEALIAAFIFAISTYSVWVARAGYLEGVEMFFIFLSIFFFLFYIYRQEKKYLFFWGISVGLALLSKYTAIFLLPAVFFYLLIWQREVFKRKDFWFSLILIGVILSPVIFYNFKVFEARGHFDAALSSMLGLHPKDFSTVSERGVNTDFLTNTLGSLRGIKNITSLPFFVFAIISLFYLLFKSFKEKNDQLVNFLLLNIVFLFLMFSFAGGSVRFLAIVTPFLSLSLTLLIYDLWQLVAAKKMLAYFLLSILILVVGFEAFYSFNTNILKKPIGQQGLFYSPNRLYNHGFNQLEDFLKNNILENNIPPERKITKLNDFRFHQIQGKEVILLDERIDWFSSMWYINRYFIYNNVPIISFTDLSLSIPQDQQTDFLEFLRKAGATGFWLIIGTEYSIVDRENVSYDEVIEGLEDQLNLAGIKPEIEIKNYKDDISFRIYHFK